MKRNVLLFLLLLLFSSALLAQETFEADHAYQKKIDSLMVNLNKSEIGTGIFYPSDIPIDNREYSQDKRRCLIQDDRI